MRKWVGDRNMIKEGSEKAQIQSNQSIDQPTNEPTSRSISRRTSRHRPCRRSTRPGRPPASAARAQRAARCRRRARSPWGPGGSGGAAAASACCRHPPGCRRRRALREGARSCRRRWRTRGRGDARGVSGVCGGSAGAMRMERAQRPRKGRPRGAGGAMMMAAREGRRRRPWQPRRMPRGAREGGTAGASVMMEFPPCCWWPSTALGVVVYIHRWGVRTSIANRSIDRDAYRDRPID